MNVFNHLETCSGSCRLDVADQLVIDEELDAEEANACLMHQHSRSTVKVVKVEGHATDELVGDGRVRLEDK